MNKDGHTINNSPDHWSDPLYLNELLTEEERSIKKTSTGKIQKFLLRKKANQE